MRLAIQGFAILATLVVAGAGTNVRAQDAIAAGRAALSECMTLKSTGQDRLIFARWIIAALGSGPQVKDIATIDQTKKSGLDREVAQTFTRLLTVDCPAQARPMFAAHDSGGISAAGETLGQLAVQELLANKEAEAAVGAFAQYLREEDFANLRK